MKTHPSCEFFVFGGNVYYNNIPEISGTYNIGRTAALSGGSNDVPYGGSPVPITSGYASLYEMNIDRISGSTDRFIGGGDSTCAPIAYDLNTTWVGSADANEAGVAQYTYTGNTGSALQGWWINGDGFYTDHSDNNTNAMTCTDCPSQTTYKPEEVAGAPTYVEWFKRAEDDAQNIGSAATWSAIIGPTGDGGTAKMTLQAWIFPTSLPPSGEYVYIIDFSYGDITLYVDPAGRLLFQCKAWSTTNGVWYTATDVIKTSQWQHIVAVYDATSTTKNPVVYVDGVSISLTESTTPAGTYSTFAGSECAIGNIAQGGVDRGFDGLIAQVGVWNQLLPEGEVSALYEAYKGVYNTIGGVYTPSTVVDNGLIYPWIIKDGSGLDFNRILTASHENYYVNYEVGDVISSSYPMSASITREYMKGPAGELLTGELSLLPKSSVENLDYSIEGNKTKCSELDPWNEGAGTPNKNDGMGNVLSCNRPKYRHYWALKSTLDSYGYMSEHYKVTASINENIVYKDQQTLNLISIPSIFYGTQIKPGSVSLKWYFTGSLAGELQDTKQNGELIQVSGNSQGFGASPGDPSYDGTGSVAGVVLYNEGFVLLTGSWALNNKTIPLDATTPGAPGKSPSWIYFGAGANDGITVESFTGGTPAQFASASYSLSFKATTKIQTMTMFANAKKGQVNYSNNPTYINYSKSVDTENAADPNIWIATSSFAFEENAERTIFNFVSSSASDYSASFKRQVYISRVGIYDDNKNLIGVATLANPVRKEEDQDLTFKIKLDI